MADAAQTNIDIPNLDTDIISLSRVTLGKNALTQTKMDDRQIAHSPHLCIVYSISDTIEGNSPDFLLILQIWCELKRDCRHGLKYPRNL